MDLAERVSHARARRGLSQRQLAAMAGLSHAYLSIFESRGHIESPTLPTIERLAEALDVPAEWLAFEVGPEPEWSSEPGEIHDCG